MKSLLIIDEACPKPYDSTTLHTTSQGGTESTVTRIAEGLFSKKLYVSVEQACRTAGTRNKIWYEGLGSQVDGADYVVCLRLPETLLKVRERRKRSDLFLWSHDLFDRNWAERCNKAFEETKAKAMICVSHFHKAQVQEAGFKGRVEISHPPIDPIVDTIRQKGYDPYRLVWFSSPHKGLDYALFLFAELHKKDPRFHLHVHNPGYKPDAVADQPGVYIEKPGSYVDTLRSVAQSLCVFYPNIVFPETFGLVFAEADALGVPVLTHDLGAAREVCDHPAELIDCKNPSKVIERVIQWSEGARPIVRANPNFSLQKSLRSFERILNG